jgi:hypothetical protein
VAPYAATPNKIARHLLLRIQSNLDALSLVATNNNMRRDARSALSSVHAARKIATPVHRLEFEAIAANRRQYATPS